MHDSSILGWDPMSEDYTSPAFNSYKEPTPIELATAIPGWEQTLTFFRKTYMAQQSYASCTCFKPIGGSKFSKLFYTPCQCVLLGLFMSQIIGTRFWSSPEIDTGGKCWAPIKAPSQYTVIVNQAQWGLAFQANTLVKRSFRMKVVQKIQLKLL